jgi:hypothetical protein
VPLDFLHVRYAYVAISDMSRAVLQTVINARCLLQYDFSSASKEEVTHLVREAMVLFSNVRASSLCRRNSRRFASKIAALRLLMRLSLDVVYKQGAHSMSMSAPSTVTA